MSSLTIARRLDRIDWNFPGAGNEPGSIHKAHWFPGNFIPQIPSALIQALSQPGDLVFDPFAGSGTTGIEAVKLKRRARISDRLSACVMIAEGKIALCNLSASQRWKSQVLSQLTWETQCHRDQPGYNGEGAGPELEAWYAPDTLKQLRFLWHLIETERDISVRKVLMLVFSDVLFACTSPGMSVTSTGNPRRHHWGWVADNVRPRKLVPHNAIRLFSAKLLALMPNSDFFDPTYIEVVQEDARELSIKSRSIDLIVTSPPYVDVIDYTRANRLLYAWMGWGLDEERSYEIGARFKRKRRNSMTDYVRQIDQCVSEMYRVLRPGGYCAVIIGEARNREGAARQVLHAVATYMEQSWGPVERRVSRRRVAERTARAAVEQICVFRKSR